MGFSFPNQCYDICLLIWSGFTVEQCGPWASCLFADREIKSLCLFTSRPYHRGQVQFLKFRVGLGVFNKYWFQGYLVWAQCNIFPPKNCGRSFRRKAVIFCIEPSKVFLNEVLLRRQSNRPIPLVDCFVHIQLWTIHTGFHCVKCHKQSYNCSKIMLISPAT